MATNQQEKYDIKNFVAYIEEEKREGHLDFPDPPAPDCLFTNREGVEIGIEHTTLILDRHPNLGDAQRAVQAKSARIIRMVRAECHNRGIDSLDLVITFDYKSMKNLRSLQEVCDDVVEIIEDFLESGELEESRYPRFPDILVNGVSGVRMNHNEGSMNVRIMHSHWSSESIDLVPLLLDACNAKSDKVEGYRTTCERLWLLLVHPEPIFGPMIDFESDYVLPETAITGWDDVFIYNRITGSFRSLKQH